MRTDVEVLRLVSAFGIVWFHSGYELGRDIAYSGLVVFLIITSYFAVNSNKRHSVASRAARLLTPCLIWSILFALFEYFRGQTIYPENYGILSKILSTPSPHLWYLPFAFLSVVVIDKLKRWHPFILASISTVFTTLFFFSSPIWRQWEYTAPFGQYMHAVPAVFVGILFAACGNLEKTQKYSLFLVLFLSLIWIGYFNLSGLSQTYIAGVVASLILLREKSFLPSKEVVLFISRHTFGVFLVHPFFLLLLMAIGISSVMLPILAFLISIISVHLMLKVIPKRQSQYIL